MRHVILMMIAALILCPPARAERAADLCEWAAATAATESGVPADMLMALTLTETGRRVAGVTRPWAWSVNAEGAGRWFDDPDSAIAFAEARVAAGRTNVDIGCFQLNYRWHGMQFRSVREMFDPLGNARYAARFLSELHREFGDWRRAAGAFHSRTPAYAARYLARFDVLRAGLDPVRISARAEMSGSDDSGQPDPSQTAAADRQPRRERPPDDRMLLGAAQGTARTGQPGSLAAIGGRRMALISGGAPMTHRPAPLFGPGTGPDPTGHGVELPL
ncbi:hypothetical protein SAMN05421538_101119 [Paracoccus isoporae]|uniref:Transglycosylase SLT domain-containing protein n=1 Tax=Paracoccus isoporae TaxID=591205 RepID=A0A1G6SWY5_9RHOB|nr:lytic transglycosylase domain-containing protein [Paracoccus isoporae]SDD21372.1 hypothetical protein SAMN05421538_101119 [Paracoccus isoporae]